MRSVNIAVMMSMLASIAAARDLSFRTQEIASDLGVGYAVTVVDMNDDKRLDIVVVDTARVIWYENPSWRVHAIIEGQTKKDNVCIAPYDIDGDGRTDFALGADWRPFDTRTGGTVQWLSRPASGDGRWNVHAIAEEPMMHRMRWADVDGDGRAELIAASLMGRDTKGPDWDTCGVRILAFRIPPDPRHDPWPVEVLNEDLHVTHNFWPSDVDGDGRPEILVASFEGVTMLTRSSDGRWSKRRVGEGNQDALRGGTSDPRAAPRSRGASEVKLGRAGGSRYIATIEPWHGFQVVVYTPPADAGASSSRALKSAPAAAGESRDAPLWRRHLLDDGLKWGHAVWCADVDGDADEELVIGVRDHLNDTSRSGVRIYDPEDSQAGRWRRSMVDPGGVAVEDLAVADFDGDGRRDIVAVGRQTHNVRIYWNETPAAQ